MLLGRPTPEVALPDELPHVRNDMGRFNEQWAEHYRGRPPAEVAADLKAAVAERRSALAGMDQATFDEESFTPAGPAPLPARAPPASLDEIAHNLGYVVGKLAAVPAGNTVRFELTGPLSRRVDVEVTDRARVVDHIDGEPTTTLTVAADHFLRLVGGRGANPDQVDVAGDTKLGASVVDNLGFLI